MNAKSFAVGLMMILAASCQLRCAPSATLKVGWYPPGGYTQEMQRITSGTVGSSIDAIVDITYATSEGPYTITPRDIIFSEGSNCPNQTTTFSASILLYSTLTNYPSQGQTTLRYHLPQLFPTQQHHSGTWTVRSAAAWQWQKIGQSGPLALEPVNITTRNLLLTEVKNGATGQPEEYCMFDPDNPLRNTIKVKYTIDDWNWGAGDPRNPTNMMAKIYKSDQTLVKTITVTRNTPGEYTEEWDGKNAQGQLIIEKGLYLFQVSGTQPTGAHHNGPDSDQDKSEPLTISQVKSAVTGYNDDTGESAIEMSYLLTDTGTPRKDAATATVRVLNPAWSVIVGPLTGDVATNASNPPDPIWNTVPFTLTLEQPGVYTRLCAAQDDHQTEDKGHRQRWGLQRGQIAKHAKAVNYQFADYPSPPPFGTVPYVAQASRWQAMLKDGTSYIVKDHVFTNETAWHALDQITSAGADTDTAVLFVFGHGGAQFQASQSFWDGYEWSFIVQTTSARTRLMDQGVPAENIVVLNEQPTGAFRSILLAVFEGCWTAYSSPSWGSPTDGIVAKGAYAALGFLNTIYSHDSNGDGAEEWALWFWQYLCGDGKTLFNAAQDAAQSTPINKNLRSFKIAPQGRGGLIIYPARWGNR